MKELQIAADFIIDFECGSKEGIKKYLKAYADPYLGTKLPTIGIGTTKYNDGRNVRMGDTITEAEAITLFEFQLKNRYMPPLTKIPAWTNLNVNQRAALLSFAYNLGANFYEAIGFNTITSALKEGRFKNVPKAMELYSRSAGKTSAGLLRRRKAEGNLWNKAV